MLKHLAIVVLAAVVLPVDGQQNGSQASSNEKAGKQTEWTVPCTVKQDRTAPNCDWSKAVPDGYFKRLFSPENAPNIALFVVGFIGIIVAICSLEKLKKQTGHIVTSERAWLIPKSMMDGYRFFPANEAIFQWKITNTGKTPARIVETSCSYEIVETKVLDQLPTVPDYPTPIELKGMLLGPGDYFARSVYLIAPPKTSRIDKLDEGEIRAIRMKLVSLRAYGYVKYLDAFDNLRESRFCEYYVWPYETVQNTGFLPTLDAPSEYTKCT